MTGSEIRRRFLEHFASREHRILPSAPLVPQRDPTTLFISAGMHPLKPYFQGVSRPPAPRLASCQKCFRTPDLEEVGKTDRHNTFFEMLGNFAPTGDYFKETAIPLAWELVTEGLKLPKAKLRVTVHPDDEESPELWRKETDVRPDWIYRNHDNWWYAGTTGPNGPDSEIWFDRGPEVGCGRPDCYPDHCERFLEFWNLVFMQYDLHTDGTRVPLPRPGVDTGMGLERMATVMQGVTNIFEIDLYKPLLEFIHAESKKRRTVSERVVADHLRGMTFVIADGVLPSNEGRGYVLRRLIRRATLHAGHLGLARLTDGIGVVVAAMKDQYPELAARQDLVRTVVGQEADKFRQTLEQGMELFERVIDKYEKVIPGEEAFRLHDTFGFPIELTRELAAERGREVDMEGFESGMSAQRERSRTMTGDRWPDVKALPPSEFTGYRKLEDRGRVLLLRRGGREVEQAAEGEEVEVFLNRSPFYAESGGQVGDTGVLTGPNGRVRVDDTQRPTEGVIAHLGSLEMGSVKVGDRMTAAVDAGRRDQVARHHSATHLLHKALREVLGEQAVQKGSWVGPDHTTFDFSLNRAVTREELERVGHRINQQIRAALGFKETHTTYAKAVAQGAMHLFEEKYGDQVRMVCFGGWTCELCGGTHVKNTADVGPALILSEASVGAGLRRIDLVAGEAAEAVIRRRFAELGDLARSLNVPVERLPERVAELREQLRQVQRRLLELEDRLRAVEVGERSQIRERTTRVPLIAERVQARDLDSLRSYADRYLERLGSGVVAVVGDGMFVIKVSRDLAGELDANRFKAFFGTGGGRPELVQGKLTRPAEDAFNLLEDALR
ncbi:MAG TPA: alanine--tRNA ligase [Candidatus Acidoferrales bacterium]|nr:alanine--tRNA ligase [Candidatus Acidoferrales bacterium]